MMIEPVFGRIGALDCYSNAPAHQLVKGAGMLNHSTNHVGGSCSVAGCEKPRKRGMSLCSMHYGRLYRAGIRLRPGLEERFWPKVDRSGGPDACWPFMGHRHGGYGRLRVEGRLEAAPRVSFFLAHGRWPEPCALHSCDNPPCCNPAHIHEGTHSQNAREREQRGRGGPQTRRRSGSRRWREGMGA